VQHVFRKQYITLLPKHTKWIYCSTALTCVLHIGQPVVKCYKCTRRVHHRWINRDQPRTQTCKSQLHYFIHLSHVLTKLPLSRRPTGNKKRRYVNCTTIIYIYDTFQNKIYTDVRCRTCLQNSNEWQTRKIC